MGLAFDLRQLLRLFQLSFKEALRERQQVEKAAS